MGCERKGANRNRFLQECTVLITKLIELLLSYTQIPSRIHVFLPEAALCMHGNILAKYRGRSQRGKKTWEHRKKRGLKRTTLQPIPHPSCQPLIYNPTHERQQANSKRSSSKGWLPREASGKSAGMSPSKSSSCERATEVQLPLGLQWNSEMEDSPGAALARNTKWVALHFATGKAQKRKSRDVCILLSTLFCISDSWSAVQTHQDILLKNSSRREKQADDNT